MEPTAPGALLATVVAWRPSRLTGVPPGNPGTEILQLLPYHHGLAGGSGRSGLPRLGEGFTTCPPNERNCCKSKAFC
jgi:hypothetical protein